MNRLQNAQKLLAQSLAALESAVEQTRNSISLVATSNSAVTDDADRPDAPTHLAPAIDVGPILQDLTAIEADLETAMKMIDNLTVSVLSSGKEKESR